MSNEGISVFCTVCTSRYLNLFAYQYNGNDKTDTLRWISAGTLEEPTYRSLPVVTNSRKDPLVEVSQLMLVLWPAACRYLRRLHCHKSLTVTRFTLDDLSHSRSLILGCKVIMHCNTMKISQSSLPHVTKASWRISLMLIDSLVEKSRPFAC